MANVLDRHTDRWVGVVAPGEGIAADCRTARLRNVVGHIHVHPGIVAGIAAMMKSAQPSLTWKIWSSESRKRATRGTAPCRRGTSSWKPPRRCLLFPHERLGVLPAPKGLRRIALLIAPVRSGWKAAAKFRGGFFSSPVPLRVCRGGVLTNRSPDETALNNLTAKPECSHRVC